MLYAYIGEDTTTARAKVQKTIAQLLSKNPDALYVRITSDDIENYSFTELTESQALFKREYIILLDSLLTSSYADDVLQHLEHISTSAHAFFLLDGKLLSPIKKKIEKHATKIEEFTNTKNEKKPYFNAFLLTDALGARDKKRAWALFREAKLHGASDEELHGIIFWLYKSLLLALDSPTAEGAGMKPYPFTKAKRYGSKFTNHELVVHTQRLATLPQHARRDGVPLEIELERFILES